MKAEKNYETLIKILSTRYSARAFQEKDVPRDVIMQIITAAQHTASWCNAQPWQVEIVSGKRIEDLREAFVAEVLNSKAAPDYEWPKAYEGIYSDRRRQCGMALYQAVGIGREDAERKQAQMLDNYRFFGAPHVAIITSDANLSVYGAVDSGSFLANFMNAATALGVATVPQAAVATHPQFLRQFLGLPDSRLIVAGISFGYADENHALNSYRIPREVGENVVKFHY